MAKKSGQPERHNQETKVKPEMDPRRLRAAQSIAKQTVGRGIPSMHDSRFAPTGKDASKK